MEKLNRVAAVEEVLVVPTPGNIRVCSVSFSFKTMQIWDGFQI